MDTYHINIYTRGELLPALNCSNFFHSPELFRILERTPGVKPYMVVVTTDDGKPCAHMLAMARYRRALFVFRYAQGRVYGEGVYAQGSDRKTLFSLMLEAISRRFGLRITFSIEFSDLSQKMFGYRDFRANGYFPIPWMHIHNSLHSKTPEERLEKRTIKKIKRAYSQGLITREAVDSKEIDIFYDMLHHYFLAKVQRYIPDRTFFQEIGNAVNGRIFVTEYNKKIIGGSAVIYSEGNAYIWFTAARQKSYPLLHPRTLTIWKAITQAHADHMNHVFFLNVGLPFERNPYRDFLLSFGGKPVSTYRWFRFNIGWINRLFSWWYRE